MNDEEKLKLVTFCDRLDQVPVPTTHESCGYTEEEWSGLKKCQYWQKFNVGEISLVIQIINWAIIHVFSTYSSNFL